MNTIMKEELKNNVCKRVINEVEDSEKEAVKQTICVLCAMKFANGAKEIYFYSSDFMNEGIDLFQLEYNVEYANGEFQNGSCMIDTKEIISSFDFVDYGELKAYFVNKYNNDTNAWQKIVQELKDKGLSPSIDESEGENAS